MRALRAKQTELFVTASIDLGAPVLDVADNEEAIVSDGIVAAAGYTPAVITPTETNAGWKPGDPIPRPVFASKAKYVMPAVGIVGIVIAVLCIFGVSGKFGHKKLVEKRESIRRSSVAAENDGPKEKQIEISDIIVEDLETERQLRHGQEKKSNFDVFDMAAVGHGTVPDLTFEEFERRHKAKVRKERE